MGFFKRLLGLETRPGEPEPLSDESFDDIVRNPDTTVFVVFFSLWCSACQVMLGLVNEVGPEYIGRARFYKMDAGKSPHAVTVMDIRSVPVLAAFVFVPEPGTCLLLGGGLLMLVRRRRRRK